jgi:hypothetical protein
MLEGKLALRVRQRRMRMLAIARFLHNDTSARHRFVIEADDNAINRAGYIARDRGRGDEAQ